MNFADILIQNGFEVVKNLKEDRLLHDSNNGWLGLTINHPYRLFKKINYSVELHLRYDELITTNILTGNIEKNQNHKKIIRIKNNNIIIYENEFGIFPDGEIMNKILK